MLTQLQNPLPIETPKGKALAVAVIDYGPNWDLLWVTFVRDSGECWTFNNDKIRHEKSTFDLYSQASFPDPDAVPEINEQDAKLMMSVLHSFPKKVH